MQEPKKISGRYIVFGFDDYYPGGGDADMVLSTNDFGEAKERIKETDYDWFQILDLDDRRFHPRMRRPNRQ